MLESQLGFWFRFGAAAWCTPSYRFILHLGASVSTVRYGLDFTILFGASGHSGFRKMQSRHFSTGKWPILLPRAWGFSAPAHSSLGFRFGSAFTTAHSSYRFASMRLGLSRSDASQFWFLLRGRAHCHALVVSFDSVRLEHFRSNTLQFWFSLRGHTYFRALVVLFFFFASEVFPFQRIATLTLASGARISTRTHRITCFCAC